MEEILHQLIVSLSERVLYIPGWFSRRISEPSTKVSSITGWPLVGNEGMNPQYTNVKVDSLIPYESGQPDNHQYLLLNQHRAPTRQRGRLFDRVGMAFSLKWHWNLWSYLIAPKFDMISIDFCIHLFISHVDFLSFYTSCSESTYFKCWEQQFIDLSCIFCHPRNGSMT